VNHFVPTRFSELAQRLALGLELLDSERQNRIAKPISVAFDGIPRPIPDDRSPPRAFGGFEILDELERVDRHASCLHALIYRKGLYRRPPIPGDPATVTLRFLSPERQFVPRRVRFELLDPGPIEAADEANPDAGDPSKLGFPSRLRSVTLWPGAAYDVSSASTGLRGRVRSKADGTPVRWTRVIAFADAGGAPDLELEVGRAHGDDRGEFLLLLDSAAGGIGPFDRTLSVTAHVFVFANAAVPVPTPEQLRKDPLWDLTAEIVATPDRTDDVLRGEKLPPGFTLQDSKSLTFQLGRFLTSEIAPFTV
jgi:hypothetical protein